MGWMSLVLIASAAGAFCSFLDNYIVDVIFRGKTPQAQKVFYGPMHLLMAVLFAIWFGIEALELRVVISLILSGFIGCGSSIFYYKALVYEDTTGASIFTQIAPVLYLIFGWLFLGEVISTLQLVAFLIFLSAPLLIVLFKRRRGQKIGWKVVGLFGLYLLGLTLAHTLFVKTVTETDLKFTTVMFYVFIGKGLFNCLATAVNKKWRKRFKAVWRREGPLVVSSLMIVFIIGVVEDFVLRLAMTMAPIALASAMVYSLRPVVVFLMGIVLTLIWPNFGREKLDKKSILVHLTAILLLILGVLLLQ